MSADKQPVAGVLVGVVGEAALVRFVDDVFEDNAWVPGTRQGQAAAATASAMRRQPSIEHAF